MTNDEAKGYNEDYYSAWLPVTASEILRERA
jgi:hypothetical protein